MSKGKKTRESAVHQVPRSSSVPNLHNVPYIEMCLKQKNEISFELIQTNLHDKVYQNAG